MKRESIIFNVTLSFVISLLLAVSSFSLLIYTKQNSDEEKLKNKYFPIVRKFIKEYKFSDDFKTANIEIVKDRKVISTLIYNPKTDILLQKELKNYILRIINLNETNYIYIKKKSSITQGLTASVLDVFVLKDSNIQKSSGLFLYFLTFGILLTILILSYLAMIRKLYPLKILREKIPHLANENFDFECCDTSKKDEVSLLGLEFKDTAAKLGKLKESRNIFLADLMNEFNTSIIEGKALIKLNNTEENAKKIEEVFNKLDILIDDFSSMKEMIISNRKDIEINHFYLEELIEKALFKLNMKKDDIQDKTQNLKLLVNDDLFSVAIKNLIENAIKYSSDKKVMISTNEDDIVFENVGDKLPYELETYFLPYLKEEDRVNDNFGLGLYIVHNILESNSYRLAYEYVDGINRFICVKRTEGN